MWSPVVDGAVVCVVPGVMSVFHVLHVDDAVMLDSAMHRF
jgi:hypothetical protein